MSPRRSRLRAASALALGLVAALGLASRGRAASGGPDNYGYIWRDMAEPGVVYAWEEISATGTDVSQRADDGNTGYQNLSFAFPYRGLTYTRVAACTNGWASLTDGTGNAYDNLLLPDPTAPASVLAVFWDDFNCTDNGSMYFQDFGDHAVIEWADVPYYSDTTKVASFQLVLHADGRIDCQIKSTTGALDSATIGIQNTDGTDGLTAWFNAGIPAPPYVVEFIPPAPIVPALDCAGAMPLDCGADILADLATGAANQSQYRCTRDFLPGKEHVYVVNLPVPTTVRYEFQALSGTPKLLVLPGCDPNDCSVPATSPIALVGATGTFYFVVDCPAGEEGQYSLRAECLPLPTALDCSTAAPIGCGETMTGDLAAGTAAQDSYWCTLADYSGREQIWVLDFPVRVATATVSLTALSGNPDLFVIFPCDANACLAPPGDAVMIPDAVGTYFVVVDCAPGDEGAYELVVTGGAPPSRNVGGTLRATGHATDTVDFAWPASPPPRPGETYAVLRAESDPTSAFTLRALPAAPAWTDPAAPATFGAVPHVWFYDVRLTDPCLNLSPD